MFSFCANAEMTTLRQGDPFRSSRFNPENLYYFPGTKSIHHFVQISCDEIGVRRVSTDRNYEFTFNFKSGSFGKGEVSNNEVVAIGEEYVVCTALNCGLW